MAPARMLKQGFWSEDLTIAVKQRCVDSGVTVFEEEYEATGGTVSGSSEARRRRQRPGTEARLSRLVRYRSHGFVGFGELSQ